MATRRRSKRLESRVVSCSNEVSVSVVVVEFSTRTLNIVLRDHFLFYFVLLTTNATTMYTKILFFCSLVFFPKNPFFFPKCGV